MFAPGASLCGGVSDPSMVVAVILVAIGGNLAASDGAPPYQSCNEAVDALGGLPGLARVATSRWYRSAPVPRSEQPDYVNGVVRLEAAPGVAEPDPAVLLAWLQRIERDHGRERSTPNAARTLDLDIVAMGEGGGCVRWRPDPILPHPRAQLRAFVLLPLRDVAPDWVHPRSGHSVAQMLALLPPEDLMPAAVRVIVRAADGGLPGS